MVEILLEYGANINTTATDGGANCLHIATIQNHLQIVKLLLKAGSPVNAITLVCIAQPIQSYLKIMNNNKTHNEYQ